MFSSSRQGQIEGENNPHQPVHLKVYNIAVFKQPHFLVFT